MNGLTRRRFLEAAFGGAAAVALAPAGLAATAAGGRRGKLGEYGDWCKHTNFELDTHVPMILAAQMKAGWRAARPT